MPLLALFAGLFLATAEPAPVRQLPPILPHPLVVARTSTLCNPDVRNGWRADLKPGPAGGTADCAAESEYDVHS
jgi:hypothetical protein